MKMVCAHKAVEVEGKTSVQRRRVGDAKAAQELPSMYTKSQAEHTGQVFCSENKSGSSLKRLHDRYMLLRYWIWMQMPHLQSSIYNPLFDCHIPMLRSTLIHTKSIQVYVHNKYLSVPTHKNAFSKIRPTRPFWSLAAACSQILFFGLLADDRNLVQRVHNLSLSFLSLYDTGNTSRIQ